MLLVTGVGSSIALAAPNNCQTFSSIETVPVRKAAYNEVVLQLVWVSTFVAISPMGFDLSDNKGLAYRRIGTQLSRMRDSF